MLRPYLIHHSLHCLSAFCVTGTQKSNYKAAADYTRGLHCLSAFCVTGTSIREGGRKCPIQSSLPFGVLCHGDTLTAHSGERLRTEKVFIAFRRFVSRGHVRRIREGGLEPRLVFIAFRRFVSRGRAQCQSHKSSIYMVFIAFRRFVSRGRERDKWATKCTPSCLHCLSAFCVTGTIKHHRAAIVQHAVFIAFRRFVSRGQDLYNQDRVDYASLHCLSAFCVTGTASPREIEVVKPKQGLHCLSAFCVTGTRVYRR